MRKGIKMEKGKILYRENLTKKFLMQLPDGLYLVSNTHENRFQSRFAEEIAALDQMPIPLIPPCDSEGSRHPVPGEAATPSERSDAGDFSSFS
jgi:hypothetical protein